MIITTAKRSRFPWRRPTIELVAPLALLGLVLSSPARAEVTVKPAISARETYSDNAQLTDADNAQGQFISDVSPSLNLIANSQRLKMFAQLNAHLYRYSGDNANTNSSSLQLNAGGKANVIDDLLYIDGTATRTRQSISAFGPQFQNDYSATNSDIITAYNVSPYLVHRFGAAATVQMRYSHDSVKSSRNLLSNSTGDSLNLNLANGPAFSTFGWNMQASHQRIDDPVAGQSDSDNLLGTLRYRFQRTLSLYTNAGYDRYTYQGVDNRTAGKNYAGGFTWTPSQRTSIDANVGRRYFGKTYSLAATMRSRQTVWNASYNDQITTARAQFLRPGSIDTASLLDASFASAFPDPIERRQAIDAYIRATGLPASVANNTNYFSNRLLLQKGYQASVALNGSRSTAIFSINGSKRTALSPADVDTNLTSQANGSLNDDTRQRTLIASFNYRLSQTASATANLAKSNNLSIATGITQDQTLVSFVLTKRFQNRLSGSVEVRHNQGKISSSAGHAYRENAVTASLSYQL